MPAARLPKLGNVGQASWRAGCRLFTSLASPAFKFHVENFLRFSSIAFIPNTASIASGRYGAP
jgi:hypothetical protein